MENLKEKVVKVVKEILKIKDFEIEIEELENRIEIELDLDLIDFSLKDLNKLKEKLKAEDIQVYAECFIPLADCDSSSKYLSLILFLKKK